MRIPPYWSRGTFSGRDQHGDQRRFRAWGWSFESMEDAQLEALARARRMGEAFASGTVPDTYEYLEHPLREEIVESFSEAGDVWAVITRNRYGALVLNCPSVCFADVDFPPVRARGVGDAILMALFPHRRAVRASADHEATIEHLRDWSAGHPRQSFRMYRTAAGLRLLFTDRLYSPTSPEIKRMFDELRCDRLYQRLTVKQESFRARLTPKPWRCGWTPPAPTYPRQSPKDEATHRRWLDGYEKAARLYGTCRLVEVFGTEFEHPRIVQVVKIHDQHACRQLGMKLA